MKKLKSEYTEASIFTDMVDEKTLEQIQNLINQKFMKDTKVAIMPDCHSGKGCVIGTTIEIKDKIVPNLVGVDIGCGMLTVSLGKNEIDLAKLDSFICKNIPSGMNVNEKVCEPFALEKLNCYLKLSKIDYLKRSICSLGGGNHFIEIDKSENGEQYLIIHTGSRNLGKQVAEIYQRIAIDYQKQKRFDKSKAIKDMIIDYKNRGKTREIDEEMKRILQIEVKSDIPDELCYLEETEFENYLHDMDICQKFASENRKQIAKRITNYLGLDFDTLTKFETIHNYINMQDMILRKGAISAYKNETVLIPINMRDGCIIARGKSNEAYNYSAPHGAGRILSRKEALETLSVADFIETMAGIYSSTVNQKTLDESPFAYKPIESILENIKDTIEIIEIIKPIYNFKSSNE